MVTTSDPLAAFPERPTPAMNFNWRALAGLASGNNVGEQFANVNSLMAQQEATQQQQAQANTNLLKENAQKASTYQALLKIDPEKATLFQAGVLDGPGAFRAIVEDRKAKQAASKPDYISVGGKIFDRNSREWIAPPPNMAEEESEYGLNPIWVMDPTTKKPRLMVTSKSGETKFLDLQGTEPVSPLKSVDTGTGTELVDARTAQTVKTVDKNLAGVEQQKVEGKTLGENRAGLPDAVAKADQAIKDIDDALTHPGLEGATGWQSAFPTLPGTSSADFEAKLAKLQGGAFLEAFESLKGGGQITEVEGNKATQAIAVLTTSQSDKQLREALRDLREVISKGKQRAALKAGAQPDTAGQPVRIGPDGQGYDQLPPGAQYIAPDGSTRVKGGK